MAFAPSMWPALRAAVADLSHLLGRGYAEVAALELVGNRYQLTVRQRMAVRRCACTDAQRHARQSRRASVGLWSGAAIAVDGFNVLTTVEVALAGGVLLRARDGCLRDIASMHGSFRRVAETEPAIQQLADVLGAVGPARVLWILDRPVGNSGRLARRISEVAVARGVEWAVQLHDRADAVLRSAPMLVATADSAILDAIGPWADLAGLAVGRLASAPVVDLAAEGR